MQTVNSGAVSARDPDHVNISDKQDINDNDTLLSSLKALKAKNTKKLVLGNLNINTINNKFEQLKYMIGNNIDVLIVTETKLDSSFPSGQFLIDGFAKPFRRDRNKNGGGIMIFIRDDIPTKEIKVNFLPSDIECLFIELNIRKVKWLIVGCYHPPSQNDEYYFRNLSKALDSFNNKYEKFLLIGDFNAEDHEIEISSFLNNHEAKNIVKEKTCFKSVLNPSCVDLFITNSPKSFQHTLSFPCGLSDHHDLVVTVLKSTFGKQKSNIRYYRDWSKFDNAVFRTKLREALRRIESHDYKSFEQTFLSLLNFYAPMKSKKQRANHKSYMTKALRKAIMKRSELASKYQKTKNNEDYSKYKKQRNFCSKLYKKERKIFYNNLSIEEITDNKKFWKTIKPLLSEKRVCGSSKINLVVNEENLSDDKEIAETFDNYFNNAVKSLNLQCSQEHLNDVSNENDPFEIAIKKFKDHPSIVNINENIPKSTTFNFNEIGSDSIKKMIDNLDSRKSGTFGGLPVNCLQGVSDISGQFLNNVWNDEVLQNFQFPSELKLADVIPVFKKEDPTLAKNYRPISLLPTVSKIFERIMLNQITTYINEYLSPFLCGYRKGFSTQTALSFLIEKWKKILDNKGYGAAILMDLSKAFDTINHELLIAKLHAYGFTRESLLIIHSYLSDRWQHVKIDSSFSSWSNLTQGVPQGSVLGPLLFNIYLNDLFFALKDIEFCNFADDTTPFVCDHDLNTVLTKLEENSAIALTWFETNYMKLNSDKCHLLVSGHNYEEMFVEIGNDKIWESKSVKLLGITIDKELKFDKHVDKICSKANRKLNVLSRMQSFLSVRKRKIVFTSFIESQFKYCPLTWMFCSRKSNNKINRLHERALRIVYNDYETTYEELLSHDNSFSIHDQNIHCLATEIYKVANDLSVGDFKNLFDFKDKYTLHIPLVNTELKGKNSIRYFGAVIWNAIPHNIKTATSLKAFKNRIKFWKPECSCRLCKTYLQGVGFINITE